MNINQFIIETKLDGSLIMKYIYKLMHSGKVNIRIDQKNNIIEMGSDISIDYKISQ